jgi:hypothetical protein
MQSPDVRPVPVDENATLWDCVRNGVIHSEDLDEHFKVVFGRKPSRSDSPDSPGRSPQRLRKEVEMAKENRHSNPLPYQRQKRPRTVPLGATNTSTLNAVIETMRKEIAVLEAENTELARRNRVIQPLRQHNAVLEVLVTGFSKLRVQDKARGKEN